MCRLYIKIIFKVDNFFFTKPLISGSQKLYNNPFLNWFHKIFKSISVLFSHYAWFSLEVFFVQVWQLKFWKFTSHCHSCYMLCSIQYSIYYKERDKAMKSLIDFSTCYSRLWSPYIGLRNLLSNTFIRGCI